VHICLDAKKRLSEKDVAARVVSMPSWELFEGSLQKYKDQVLPPEVTIGINRFGASAPGDTVMEKFGFTVENVVTKALEILKK
jgi:transketolase